MCLVIVCCVGGLYVLCGVSCTFVGVVYVCEGVYVFVEFNCGF